MGRFTFRFRYQSVTLLVLFFLCAVHVFLGCADGGSKSVRSKRRHHSFRKSSITFSKIRNLRHIPLADREGIVLQYKRLSISQVGQAFNPSIVKADTGYFLAFRNEEGLGLTRKSYPALACLDQNFHQKGKTSFFHTNHPICEDPRCLTFNDQLYLVYSHVWMWKPYTTAEAIAKLDIHNLSLSDGVDFQFHPQRIEKNWIPFVYANSSGPELYFVYSYNPFTLLRPAKSLDGSLDRTFLYTFPKKNLEWERKWGKICGGTPALLVDDEYLTFFHSSFWSKGIRWYVMGAYTFSKTPPFEPKRISQYPLMFKQIYQTPMHKNVWFRGKFRVVFPGGFVEEEEGGRKVFHLAYGENDSGICILTLDKTRLLASLHDVP